MAGESATLATPVYTLHMGASRGSNPCWLKTRARLRGSTILIGLIRGLYYVRLYCVGMYAVRWYCVRTWKRRSIREVSGLIKFIIIIARCDGKGTLRFTVGGYR